MILLDNVERLWDGRGFIGKTAARPSLRKEEVMERIENKLRQRSRKKAKIGGEAYSSRYGRINRLMGAWMGYLPSYCSRDGS